MSKKNITKDSFEYQLGVFVKTLFFISVFGLLLGFCITGGISGFHYLESMRPVAAPEVVAEMESKDLHTDDFIGKAKAEGICTEELFDGGVNVFTVEAFEEPSVGGKFRSHDNASPIIILRDIDIATISHEVSHFVDYILATRQIQDTETEAYLQGYYTECVQRLAVYDSLFIDADDHLPSTATTSCADLVGTDRECLPIDKQPK